MGYTLLIGQRTTVTRDDGSVEDSVNDIAVLDDEFPGPFGTKSDGRNSMSVSYSSMDKLMAASGLYLYLNGGVGEGGYLGAEGVTLITPDTPQAIQKCISNWSEASQTHAWEHYVLKWMDHWSQWALKNCDDPVILIR